MTTFLAFPEDGGPHSGASVGQALAGLVARDSAGMPRKGMLAAPSIAAVAATWKVQVGRFIHVDHVNGAIRFSGLSEAEQVDITPASGIPAGQGRIDRVAWSRAASELVLLEGAVSASPVAPGLGDLVPVLRVRVDAGDGMVVTGKVTSEFTRTHGDASVVKGTSPLTLTGTAGSGAGNSWRTFVTVPFGRTFDKPPHVEATAVFPSASVQFLEITSVTETGFSGRIVRISHTTPVAGTVHWTATEI